MNFRGEAVGDLDDQDAHSISARFRRIAEPDGFSFSSRRMGRSGGSNLAIDKSPRNEEVGHMKNLEIHFIYASACSPRCRDTRACGTRLSFFLGWIPARLPLLFEFLPSSSPPPSTWFYVVKGKRTTIFFSTAKCTLRGSRRSKRVWFLFENHFDCSKRLIRMIIDL